MHQATILFCFTFRLHKDGFYLAEVEKLTSVPSITQQSYLYHQWIGIAPGVRWGPETEKNPSREFPTCVNQVFLKQHFRVKKKGGSMPNESSCPMRVSNCH